MDRRLADGFAVQRRVEAGDLALLVDERHGGDGACAKRWGLRVCAVCWCGCALVWYHDSLDARWRQNFHAARYDVHDHSCKEAAVSRVEVHARKARDAQRPQREERDERQVDERARREVGARPAVIPRGASDPAFWALKLHRTPPAHAIMPLAASERTMRSDVNMA